MEHALLILWLHNLVTEVTMADQEGSLASLTPPQGVLRQALQRATILDALGARVLQTFSAAVAVPCPALTQVLL